MGKFAVVSSDAIQTLSGVIMAFIVSWRVTFVSLVIFPIAIAEFFICEHFIGKL